MTRSGPISLAVTRALKSVQINPRDVAGVALVRRYAGLIDDHGDNPVVVGNLGPKLLAALTALGMTPAGRAEKKGTADVSGVAAKLDELRARRVKRAGSD